ncbi:MAG: 50S ribosomal protein L18 [Planctomycetota bacterium]
MNKLIEKRMRRIKRRRAKIYGTPVRPRLTVFRSNKHFYSQIIDDTKGITLAAASTLSKELKTLKKTNDINAAKLVGHLIAEKARSMGIIEVVCDIRHYRYHGKIKAFAEAAREGGLKF